MEHDGNAPKNSPWQIKGVVIAQTSAMWQDKNESSRRDRFQPQQPTRTGSSSNKKQLVRCQWHTKEMAMDRKSSKRKGFYSSDLEHALQQVHDPVGQCSPNVFDHNPKYSFSIWRPTEFVHVNNNSNRNTLESLVISEPWSSEREAVWSFNSSRSAYREYPDFLPGHGEHCFPRPSGTLTQPLFGLQFLVWEPLV